MSQITIRDPFGHLHTAFERAFEPFRRFEGWEPSLLPTGVRDAALPLDVFETAEGLTLEAPLPGFTKEQVKVTLERGKLSIRAERKEERAEREERDGRTYFVREMHRGAVSRSLTVGEGYDAQGVSAALKDGVLRLTIKKTVAAQPREIAIEG